MSTEASVAQNYKRRIEELQAEHGRADRKWRSLANQRLALFVLLALAVWWYTRTASAARAVELTAVVVLLIGFMMLVRMSSRARREVQRLAALVAINQEGIPRIEREWSQLPRIDWPAVESTHPYAGDLDILGTASLVRLLPAISPAPGRSTLMSWLLNASDPEQIVLRQQSVAELRGRIDFRDAVVLHGRHVNIGADSLLEFQNWSSRIEWRADKGWLTAVAWAVPLVTLLLAVLQATGILSHAYWLLPVALGAIPTLVYRKRLRTQLGEIQGRRNMLRSYARIARVIAQEHFDAPLLTQLKERLGSGESGAADSMALLERLAERADVRLSPMLHFFVQGLTLWDFHIGRRLIDWKQRAGNDITGWMDAIGAIESLVALATLSYDNPDWVFPAIVAEAEPKVVAAELGHPLIAAEFRVANDVTVGPPNTLLLISGSNMAGKSTMLRSIGLNVVLAQAGSVVCATAMSCPHVSLYTSMRVQDSLERGVSYFMAELERLKLIVDAAGDARVSGGRPLLYLLDEILHGTNSAERSIAARHVLLRLVELGAIGAVTTHDLQLAEVDEFARIANHVHFREEFSRDSNGRPAMRFDYRLRAGKAESSNALKLLELVGLAPDLANGAQEYDVRQ